jgi:hypothetical protein
LLDQIRSENTFLRERLAAAEAAQAELRRMLNLEQQTVAALRALPAPTAPVEMPLERAEPAESAPAGLEPPDTPPADLAQALKEAGVKKKQRRKLLVRLTAAWRR